MLDGNSPVSLQYQLKCILIDKIKTNEWQKGSLIPSERELCEIYGVSRMTVRAALRDIKDEGYLTRKQGKGTYATSPKIEQRLNKFYSFSEEVKELGLKPSALVIGFEVIDGDSEITQYLALQKGSKLYKISRLRLAGDDIFAYEISYIPYQISDKLTVQEIQDNGLYNTIRKYSGLFPDEAIESFEAVMATNEVAFNLKMKKKSAVLKLERFAKSQGKCIEYCICMIHGEKFKYKVLLK